jgi:hypothetical protein
VNRDKHLTLDGLQQLEDWADTARHIHKNQLYKALFAVTDGTVDRHYGVLQDTEDPDAHFIIIREDLVLKVNYPDRGSFGITYIGPLEDAPGINLALQTI